MNMKAKYYTYRNLNCGESFSTKYRGLVEHRFSVGELTDVTFRVSQAGNKRARLQKKRNVHAFVVSENKAKVKKPIDISRYPKVRYNPFEAKCFTVNGKPIESAKKVFFQGGCLYLIEE